MRDGGPEGRPAYLPSGYRLDETDREFVILRREDGSEVAVFSATGADPREVERRAWEDGRRRGKALKSTASIAHHFLMGGHAAGIAPLRTAFPKGHALTGVQLKLERAWRHLVALNDEIAGFFVREPYLAVRSQDSDGVSRVSKIYVREQPPLEWSAIAGDCLQNMRSALEYLAWELARLEKGAEPSSSTSFPIFLEPEGFYATKNGKPRNGSGLHKIREMSWEAQGLVEMVQPFRRTGGVSPGVVPHDGREGWKRIWRLDALWMLNELARFDRHRALRLVGAVRRSPGYPPVKEQADSQDDLFVFGAPPSEAAVPTQANVFIEFEEPVFPTGWSVIGNLSHILGRIDGDIVPLFDEFF